MGAGAHSVAGVLSVNLGSSRFSEYSYRLEYAVIRLSEVGTLIVLESQAGYKS